MKKYLILSFLFLLVVTPVFAKNTTQAPPQQAQNKNTITPATSITPTGNQVKNQNQIQTQNQGEDQQLSVQNQEEEQLDQNLNNNFQKVSDQVHQLIDTVGAKGGIGPQVKEIAQNQIKNQENIKSNLAQLQLRKYFVKFFIGSDKKTVQNVESQLEQSKLMIQQLEELKLQTTTPSDLQQLQETIDLMTYQNTFLEEKINLENKTRSLFGWLINFFNR